VSEKAFNELKKTQNKKSFSFIDYWDSENQKLSNKLILKWVFSEEQEDIKKRYQVEWLREYLEILESWENLTEIQEKTKKLFSKEFEKWIYVFDEDWYLELLSEYDQAIQKLSKEEYEKVKKIIIEENIREFSLWEYKFNDKYRFVEKIR
jgi:FMN phosphatase YigB (HAD superfamily)